MCTSDWVKPKASVLKGIFGRWTKDVVYLSHYEPPDVTYTMIFQSQFGHAYQCMFTQGKEPLMELFSLEDVSYNYNVIQHS